MPKTILIVEDDEMNMKLYCDVLAIRGHQTVGACNGRTVLPLVREHNPDLILMNIRLPDVSGLEVTHWIKRDQSLRHIPVIAVTGFAMHGDEEKILACGCDAYISKPIDILEFLGAVQKMLGE